LRDTETIRHLWISGTKNKNRGVDNEMEKTKKKVTNEKKDFQLTSLDWTGVATGIAGFLLMILPGIIYIQLTPNDINKINFIYTFAGVGFGIIGAGIGLLGLSSARKAMDISNRSDEKMTAISYLEFHEKMGMRVIHDQTILTNMSVLPDRIVHNISAIALLKTWLKQIDRDEMKNSIRKIISSAGQYKDTQIWNDKNYEEMINKLNIILKELDQ
jgi:hypothetical protein